MEDHRGNEEQLQRQLQETREKYQQSCDEVQELREQLASSTANLEEQYQLLSGQVTTYRTFCCNDPYQFLQLL